MAFWQSPLVAFVRLWVLSIESQRKWNISRPSLAQDNGSGLAGTLNGVERSHGALLARDYLNTQTPSCHNWKQPADYDDLTSFFVVLIINFDKVCFLQVDLQLDSQVILSRYLSINLSTAKLDQADVVVGGDWRGVRWCRKFLTMTTTMGPAVNMIIRIII